MSHDLKNPALAIHGLAGVIRKKHPNLPGEKLESFLAQILHNAEQIVNLSDDINTYISTRETPLNFVNLDLKKTWEAVRKEFMTRLEKMGIAWSETEKSIPEIRADRNALLRVYRNLVDNALKYGGGRMTEICLDYGSSATHHILSVQNDGEIIGPEDIDLIFDIFKRRTGYAAPAGTGLGLAIVREIAKHHCGSSWVESGPAGKTTFYISIARNL